METIQSALHEMTGLSKQLIRGCEKPACDGTVLYTPDGVGNYDALWVRDFGYMAEYCGDLMGAPGAGSLPGLHPDRPAGGRLASRPD